MKKLKVFRVGIFICLTTILFCAPWASAEENGNNLQNLTNHTDRVNLPNLPNLYEMSIESVASEGHVISRSFQGQVEEILVGIPFKVELSHCIAALAQMNVHGVHDFDGYVEMRVYGASNPDQERCENTQLTIVEKVMTYTFQRRWSNETDSQWIKLKIGDELRNYWLHVDYTNDHVVVDDTPYRF